MKILVLNGSPKGEYSITLQTVYYLQKKYKDCEFEVLHVGQRIKGLEKDFAPAAKAIREADVLLFSYPVYTFIAPYQLHRFIELMKEQKVEVPVIVFISMVLMSFYAMIFKKGTPLCMRFP